MIYRTGDTRIPNPLLIDLPPPSDYASDQSPFGSKQNLQESSVGEATPPVVKKMTMMKRNPNRDNDVKKESSKKEKQTAEEKEKAYAEARARIFGAEAEAATSTAAVSTVVPATTHLKKSTSEGKLEKAVRSTSPRAGSASPPPPVTTGQNATNSTAANGAKKKVQPPAAKKPVGVEGNGSASTSSKSADQPRTSTVSPAPSDSANDSGKGKKKTVDVTGWKEKKFTVRDQDAERSDPDFSRRNVSTSQSTGRGNSQHPQYVQPNQFRGPEDQMSGYQGQGQGVGMAPGGAGYQQNYQLPQDPYQYGQNGQNVMMPYGPQGVHNIYVQGPFAMNHIAMGSTPGSPPHPQQQWQQPHPQGMMMNQHPGNPTLFLREYFCYLSKCCK
jgi:SUZ domain